jgi:hypothetical protein
MPSPVDYLRVVGAVWMRPAPRLAPAIAGASAAAATVPALPRRTGEPGRTPEGTPSGGRCGLVLGSMLLTAGATVVFGIVPSPLIDFSIHAGEGLASMLGL